MKKAHELPDDVQYAVGLTIGAAVFEPVVDALLRRYAADRNREDRLAARRAKRRSLVPPKKEEG